MDANLEEHALGLNSNADPADVFKINRVDGQRLRFNGNPTAPAPRPTFLRLGPRQTLVIQVRLNACYEFRWGYRQIVVRYMASNPAYRDQGSFRITSEKAFANATS